MSYLAITCRKLGLTKFSKKLENKPKGEIFESLRPANLEQAHKPQQTVRHTWGLIVFEWLIYLAISAVMFSFFVGIGLLLMSMAFATLINVVVPFNVMGFIVIFAISCGFLFCPLTIMFHEAILGDLAKEVNTYTENYYLHPDDREDINKSYKDEINEYVKNNR